MSGQQAAPTRMNLTLYKEKKKAAVKGHSLLKQKADALKVRFRDLCKQIYSTKNGMGSVASDSFFTLTEAEYAAGNIRDKVFESVGQASVRLHSRTDNVAGVKLPVFSKVEVPVKESDPIGLAQGGRKVGVCKSKFMEYTERLIKLASLQTSFVAMDEALKITNRRVNALENVTIPNINDTIAFINRELDELEREDFTRLKVVKRKKEEYKKKDEILKRAVAVAAAGGKAEVGVAAPETVFKANTSGGGGGGAAAATKDAAGSSPTREKKATKPLVDRDPFAIPESTSAAASAAAAAAPTATTATSNSSSAQRQDGGDKKKKPPKKKGTDSEIADDVFS
jgi:V-type H+-transporting ATPase subunit D